MQLFPFSLCGFFILCISLESVPTFDHHHPLSLTLSLTVLAGDNSTCLRLLLNYPTVDRIHSLIERALDLQNPEFVPTDSVQTTTIGSIPVARLAQRPHPPASHKPGTHDTLTHKIGSPIHSIVSIFKSKNPSQNQNQVSL